MTNDVPRHGPSRLPIFPLETVLYPGQSLPLHVFEERYRALVQDLLARPADERVFGVVAIRVGREVGVEAALAVHDLGCLAHVRHVDGYDDGRFDLVAVGGARFRLRALLGHEPYPIGDVEMLDDDALPPSEDIAATVSTLAARYLWQLGHVTGDGSANGAHPAVWPRDARELSYDVAARLALDLDERQRLLAAEDTATRLRLEAHLLAREITLLDRLRALPAGDLLRRSAPAARTPW